MTPRSASKTRRSPADSPASSTIGLSRVRSPADDSSSEHPTASTTPTSMSDNRSLESSKPTDAPLTTEETEPRRSGRQRASVSVNALNALHNAPWPASAGSSRKPRPLPGRNIANPASTEEEQGGLSRHDVEETMPDAESPAESPRRKAPRRAVRNPTVTDRVKNSVKNATESVRSVLGKRGRDLLETGKKKLGMAKQENEDQASPQKNKLLKQLEMGKGGVLDELDLDTEDLPAPHRPAKRVKTTGKAVLQEIAQPVTTGPLQKTSDGKKVKKWHNEGLYVGQTQDTDPTRIGSKKTTKKRPASAMEDGNDEPEPRKKSTANFSFPLPMFSYLDNARDFVIPYDVFAPAPNGDKEKPKDWKQINKNRLVGEAKDLWDRSEKLAQSSCVCRYPDDGELGCDYDCLNRVMQYECNKDNCNLEPGVCSNRPFAELAERTKKGGSFDIGVEVVKTQQRGHGVRAARSFKPGQIIMEYTGEIISEGECQRRMREDYKDKSCYYLMELERQLVIDGTRGNMARFINHSCDPNCEVRMIKANGTPRMAVFAGDSGIMTGEELTYDYNFDNFGETRQPCYCGANICRGYLGKRLNATEMKKQQKEDAERKRKAAEMAQKAAEEEQRKRKVKNERGPGWRGWVPVAEVKAELLERKRVLEEQEKNSSRAKRLAARRGSVSGENGSQSEVMATPKKATTSRRNTVGNPGQAATEPKHLNKEPGKTSAKPVKKKPSISMEPPSTEVSDGKKNTNSKSVGTERNGRGNRMRQSAATSSKDLASTESEVEHAATKPVKKSSIQGESKASEKPSKPAYAASSDLDNEDSIVMIEPEQAEKPANTPTKRTALTGTVSNAADAVRSASVKWKQTKLGFSKLP